MKKSLFITFEGLEGSGKSVQVGLLAAKLREEGHDIVVTREPGGTRVGEQIRTITHNPQNVDLIATTEAYLMAAARAQHVRELIRPALEAGKIVICDRFVDSSIAYQGYGREMGREAIESLNTLALDSVQPDITILLDITVEMGTNRRLHTDKMDRLDLQSTDFYERVKKGYTEIAENAPERIKIVDASKSPEEVQQEIWNLMTVFFESRK